MSRIVFVVFALAALWAGYWVIGSRALETRLTAWLDARRAEGWVAEAGAVTVRGFPNRFDTTIETLTLADPETGVAWSMPFFQILALSYRPNHVIAVWPDTQVLATPAERLDIASERMRGSVVFRPDTALALDRTTIVMENVGLTSADGWMAWLAEARLATRPAGREWAHDIAFEARDFAPGVAVLSFLDPAGRLPRELSPILAPLAEHRATVPVQRN